jgi:hypothetical protein
MVYKEKCVCSFFKLCTVDVSALVCKGRQTLACVFPYPTNSWPILCILGQYDLLGFAVRSTAETVDKCSTVCVVFFCISLYASTDLRRMYV